MRKQWLSEVSLKQLYIEFGLVTGLNHIDHAFVHDPNVTLCELMKVLHVYVSYAIWEYSFNNGSLIPVKT